MDITKEWITTQKNIGQVIKKQEYIIKGTKYKVDGHHVVLEPDYLIDGERFDLKSPTGSGKYLIKGLIAKKKKTS